ncbi:hypothetical protein [Leptothermofonsia sp. ETS-13]|uniref:hypothetical protein n=1 Tax=Leptothermofonsia sp. ETS-13 TaxID=3035696 RepID=UPI003B9F0FF8
MTCVSNFPKQLKSTISQKPFIAVVIVARKGDAYPTGCVRLSDRYWPARRIV